MVKLNALQSAMCFQASGWGKQGHGRCTKSLVPSHPLLWLSWSRWGCHSVDWDSAIIMCVRDITQFEIVVALSTHSFFIT